MYEQLLKLENYELSKKPAVSWERILEIRHLKDRMMRKCQKLAKTTMPMSKKSSRGDTFVFQTFVAPQDFRPPSSIGVFKTTYATLNNKSRTPFKSQAGCILKAATHYTTSTHRSIGANTHSPVRRFAGCAKLPANHVSSPTTRPHSRQREALELDEPEGKPPNIASLSLGPDPPPEIGPSDPAAEASPRPILSRRPSCIKRDSVGDLKRVSWADNQHELDNQLSKYVIAAREAQASGKWEEVRVLYLEQIAGLESLQQQVQDGLEHLRSETEHLQRIDETIRKQREALDSTFHDFEQKHNLLKEKVQEALTEANDTLTRHGGPRELEPIHEAEH
ncbi:hypothetical protein NLJ89_g1243 [Agrocybe chaxingu]|uniref:Uncharacterized protein n=1 Tax=Agrocybe chaxingu TaxID=84603 RepID=A0A9W8TDN0_9AGAR|nr:hypothetical protein NLJ89_g1243 [Agrocybe chaxingu]